MGLNLIQLILIIYTQQQQLALMDNLELPISENDSDLLPNGQEVPIITNHHHYRDVESQTSEKPPSNIDELLSETKPFELKIEKVEPHYQLHLPESKEMQVQQIRAPSRQSRHGRILIQEQRKQPYDPNEQTRKIRENQRIKIYDLEQQEKQESVLDVSLNEDANKEPQDIIPIQVSVSKHPVQVQVIQHDDNSFLEVQPQKNAKLEPTLPSKHSDEFSLKIQHSRKQENLVIKHNQTLSNDALGTNKSKIIGGIKGKVFQFKKGLFSQEDKQDYVYSNLPNVDSRSSLETGMHLTTSRDELSSRHILEPVSPQRSRKRLPALKPLNETLQRREEKLFELQQYKKIQVLQAEYNQMKTLSNGKFAILKEEITDLFRFVCKSIPYDKCVETTITRNKACLKLGYLDYDLSTNDNRYLLSCKKMPWHLGSTYNISLQKNAFADNSQYLVGKVKGNFVGSTFNIYSVQQTDITAQQLDATVYYAPECSCCKVSTREVQIYMKNRSFRYEELTGAESGDNKNLKELYEIENNRTLRKIFKYVNKKAKWNPEREIYTINLRKKSKFASVKNMVIVNADISSEQGLLLAKKGENEFQFDISYPFTPIIALGVAMTSFDFKLATQ